MKTEEICMLKKSIKWAAISLLIASLFWFLFSLQAAYAYTPNGSPADLKSGSRINAGSGSSSLFLQPGTGTSGGSDTANFRIVFGTQSTTGNGSTGFILPGTTTGLPFIDYLFSSGSSTFNFSGFGAIAVDGETIPSVGTVSNKLDSVGGVGTNNTFNNPTFSGAGTITASFGANGLVISPEEYSMLDGATVPLNTATGSITNHAHTGSDGTTQVSHANLTDRGTQTHTQIDTFIASKASASGVASLDANSLVVQNPASGTSTPGVSKIVMSDGTGKVLDGWLSANVPLVGIIELGTDTTGNADNISGGSTNKYYSEALFTDSYKLKTKWSSLGIFGNGTLNINTSGDATHTASYNSATGEGTITISISGSATAKADIKESGNTTVTNASFLDFNNNSFDTTINGTGADINLSLQRVGTTTPTEGYSAIFGTSSNAFVVQGIICLWSGSVASIPSGWHLCDGTNNTPDLRNRFVIGAGSTYAPADTGGTSTHKHTESAHTHSVDPPNTASSNQQDAGFGGNINTSASTYWHNHNVDIAPFSSASGSSTVSTETVLPPYYALCYIMKL